MKAITLVGKTIKNISFMENNNQNNQRKGKDLNPESHIPEELLYPPSEDIYNKLKKESDIDPEDITKNKIPVEINSTTKMNEKSFEDDFTGSDLDVPGGELDNAMENIGSEDEENNYYSLGGDNHNDLEENEGDIT